MQQPIQYGPVRSVEARMQRKSHLPGGVARLALLCSAL